MIHFSRRHWLPLSVACVLLCGLVLVACGGDQTAETPAESAANEEMVVSDEPAAADEPADGSPPITREPVEEPTEELPAESAEVPVDDPTAEPTIEAADLGRGRIELATVPSPSLANAVVYPVDSNDVFVYLPPGYNISEKQYPVIYSMAGVGFSQFPPQEGISTITYLLDGLWKDGTLPVMMFVFCQGGGPLDIAFFTVNSSFQGDVPGFCARDVVEYIDASYRTLATPAGRGLLGDTLTGDAALRMAEAYPDVFSTVYINLPWVLAEGALEDTYFTQPLVVEAMLGFAEILKEVPPDEVGTTYLELVNQINSPGPGFSLAYAMQYLANPEPPYFSYLYTDADTLADPEVWKRWEAGVGDLGQRVAQGKEGLTQLAGLGIGRARRDTYSPWAVAGTDELHRVLIESDVPHQWDEYSGDGFDLKDQLDTVIMPFFAEHLEIESSP